jgi:hypothetical protein
VYLALQPLGSICHMATSRSFSERIEKFNKCMFRINPYNFFIHYQITVSLVLPESLWKNVAHLCLRKNFKIYIYIFLCLQAAQTKKTKIRFWEILRVSFLFIVGKDPLLILPLTTKRIQITTFGKLYPLWAKVSCTLFMLILHMESCCKWRWSRIDSTHSSIFRS